MMLSPFLLLLLLASSRVDAAYVRSLRTTEHTLPVGRDGATGITDAQTASTAQADPALCNGYAELCERRYSNVSMVGAHNSPFVLPNNLAANQALAVTQQLDDGIRFLQAQIQWPTNGTEPHFCHTSCDLLDAGPIASWLGEVRQWVDGHPRDVVTILLGNGNYSTPDRYAPAIESTGIVQYAYVPPRRPMQLQDWPTLGEMIAADARVVLLLDYQANETAYPWLLDEFAYLWETPFDPTIPPTYGDPDTDADTVMPCTVQRPPGLADSAARDGLYLMNHNLNVVVSLLGTTFMVPAVSLANQTNAAAGSLSLGASAQACAATWGRPPLVLNVDYYNYGTPPGSVFQVAAMLNNVTYNGTCCGRTAPAVSGGMRAGASLLLTTVVVLVTSAWLW